ADHRVLDGVRDHEEHDEVEGRELAGLALAEEAETDDQADVDDGRPGRDTEQVRAEVRDRHRAMLADRPSRYHRSVPAPTVLRTVAERALRTSLLWLSRR